jgi:hypothetical protein
MNLIIAVFLLAMFPKSFSEYSITDIVIMPPSQTNRGAIGAGRICPFKEFAIGYRLKMHSQVNQISFAKSISLIIITNFFMLQGWRYMAK